MDLIKLFESLTEKIISEEEKKISETLDVCLNIKSPMKFSDEITDEHIFQLIEHLKEQEILFQKNNCFQEELINASAKKSNTNIFI